MKQIQMVDLFGQYEHIRDEVNARFQEVLNSSAFINGPEVKLLASNLESYLGVKHVIPCANGTDALQIAIMALDLEPGSEIITPNFTFVSTVEVVALMGHKPVLVDVESDTFNINPAEIEKAITDKTAAIIPVHLFGQCANMEAILSIAEKHGLAVIEDNAQAIGADYKFNGQTKKAGAIGDIGTTSFFPSKNLGCYGDGGAIFTNNDELAHKIRTIANHGQAERYYYDSIGVNSRLDTLQAAVLNIKLRHLDEYAESRNKAALFYDQAFRDVSQLTVPYRSGFSTHVFHQYTLKVEDGSRDELKEYLNENDIPAMVYYPVPLHRQKAYADKDYHQGRDFPVTEELSTQVISLPMHTELEEEQLEYIIDHVKEFFNNKK